MVYLCASSVEVKFVESRTKSYISQKSILNKGKPTTAFQDLIKLSAGHSSLGVIVSRRPEAFTRTSNAARSSRTPRAAVMVLKGYLHGLRRNTNQKNTFL
jgi:hypothetical protein